MKEILHAIHKSIAERPPNYNDAESLLDMLFWHYTESNALDNEKIKEQFDTLRKSVTISREEYDDFFYIVCSLCLEHGRLAFIEGLRLGVVLMQELNIQESRV